MRSTTLAVATAMAIVAATLAAVPPAGAVKAKGQKATKTTIAVIGDTPYGQPQIDNFKNDVGELNADRDTTRVIHLGDIKNGSSVCSTDYFEQIRADFDLFDKPLVYTPGDNEWTDCHRASNGAYHRRAACPAARCPRA